MNKSIPVTTLFLDIGGVMLSNGWGHQSRRAAADVFNLEFDEMDERHHVIQVTYEEGKITLNLDSEVPGLEIYYTIDGAMPNTYSPKYSKPVELPEGPVTVRVVTYRDGKQIGHLITLTPEQLKKRHAKD